MGRGCKGFEEGGISGRGGGGVYWECCHVEDLIDDEGRNVSVVQYGLRWWCAVVGIFLGGLMLEVENI